MKFTKEALAALALPPGKTDHFEWDDELPSFGVRLRGRSKRWVVQYRVGTQQRRESLGDVRKVKLEDARKIARQRFAQVELGSDPAVRIEEANALIFARACTRPSAARPPPARWTAHAPCPIAVPLLDRRSQP